MLEGNLVEVLMFRFSIPLCITKEAKLSTKSKSRELLLLHLKRNERIGNVMFRENIAMNVKFWKEVKSLKVLSSKSRVRTESHIDFHLDIQSSFFIQIQTRLFNESIRFSSNSSINVQNHFQVEVEALVIQGPKLANAMSQVKKLEVSILVLGQKKPSSFFSCSSCSNTEEFLEYCINNGECLTIGVRKRSKGNNGYLISTRDKKSVDFKKLYAHVHQFKDSSAKFRSNFRTEWKRKNNSLAVPCRNKKPTSGSIHIYFFGDDGNSSQSTKPLVPKRVGIVFQFSESLSRK
ncbi:unnamed protein product [Trifolium pratense]|uniref:Uncharacterized protein n=1 Tax=Trifolium pratense TaxID=57577 RepID=A0ACB0L2R8_TRIPR|nr:unnamed protein product [Trifolium pratense]